MKRWIHAANESWSDDPNADLYIVKIWHEVDSPRAGSPHAAEEIFRIVATSPDQAKEYAKQRWQGPIDRIEIVDVNPEY